jgi:hypothetical protein
MRWGAGCDTTRVRVRHTLSWLLAFGMSATAARVINFDTAPLGKTPPEWKVAMTNRGHWPQWEIVVDHSAPTQPYVLAQVSADRVGDRYPLAILKDFTMRDGEVSVRVKPVSGHDTQAGGLVWHYRDEHNYYVARINALERNVQVFKVENGVRSPLMAPVRHEVPTNVWSILKVAVKGNRFQIYVDHRRVLQGNDNTFKAAGGVGLWTVGDSVVYFDDFRILPK